MTETQGATGGMTEATQAEKRDTQTQEAAKEACGEKGARLYANTGFEAKGLFMGN